jgi:tRNA dimethylallyltransferase
VNRVLALVGPTAAGKSALAIEVCQAVGGEVVSIDSMAVYRGMDIGTAKPTSVERAGIPHHMIDVWPIDHAVTVAEFQQRARQVIADIGNRGRIAVLVGGSGLYVSAVLDDLQFPGTDPMIRARWEQALEQQGSTALHALLAERDPAAAIAIQPTNGRRIVRALEVIELTGEPFTASLPRDQAVIDADRIGIDVPRDVMDERIEQRVDAMWRAGLVAEVRQLMALGLAQSRTASRALGYQQVIEYLAGRCTESEAKLATVEATKKFARRQVRWFRRDQRVMWVAFPTTASAVMTAWGTAT